MFSMKTKRFQHSLVEYEKNKMIATGGNGLKGYLKSCEMLDKN